MDKGILIIEDDILVAENTVFLLKQSGYADVTHADTIDDVKAIFKAKKIELIISDINLHGINDGPKIVKQIQQQHPVAVIYLTAYSEEQIVDDAMATNPVAFVLKPYTDRQLLVAVQIAFRQIGESGLSESIDRPSARELQVIEEIARGLNNKQISEILFLSEHTVKTHRRNLIRRYRLRTSSELIAMAARLKWIDINKFK